MENETTGLMPLPQNPYPAPQSHATEVEKSRAMTEVQSAIVAAKRDPRNLFAAYTRIMEACEISSLAKAAIYSYPRGGQTISGPSVKLAEVMAQNYGNIHAGILLIERSEGKSLLEAFCWDLETNYKVTKRFEVPHEISLQGGKMKKLTDPRDIAELESNIGSRNFRSCVLRVIPANITEDAMQRCRRVQALGDKNDPMENRIKRVLLAFKAQGVTQKMIEDRLEHPIDITTAEELVDLQSIYNSLKDRTAERDDFFGKAADTNAEGMKAALEKGSPTHKKT